MPIAYFQFPIEKPEPAAVLRLSIGDRQSAVGNPHSSFVIRASDFIRHSNFGFRVSHKGFTLVELMLSLAMVLILIVGINFVFRSATDAVGAGNALNNINSDSQATGPMLFDDLRNVSKNPPCFIISSQLVTQFLNADDAKTGSDPTVIVTDNAGTTVRIANGAAGSFLSPAILNSRNHRADMLKFFAHALYHRRSGDTGTYFGSESSNDAYVEYGHAALPSNDLSLFYGPSSLPNTVSGVYNGVSVSGVPRVGAYAADWVLARRITLMLPGAPWTNSTPPVAPNPQSISNDDYYYAMISANALPLPPTPAGDLVPPPNSLPMAIDGETPFGANMSPLSYGTRDYYYDPAITTQQPTVSQLPWGVTQAQSSRYDIAGATIDQFDRLIANAILGWQSTGYQSPNAATPTATAASLWWNPLVYCSPLAQNQPTPPLYFSSSLPPYSIPYNFAVPAYTYPLPPTPGNYPGPQSGSFTPPAAAQVIPPAVYGYGDPGLWYNRPQCNPTIQSPVNAASLAEMAPYFLQHCSQFIVEYAGDYMQQDNNQYLPSPPNPPNTINPHYGAMTGIGADGQIDFYVDANGNKHIRWYGMPRSSTGTPHFDGPTGATKGQVLIRGYDSNPATFGTLEDPTVSGAAGTYNALLNYFTDVIPLRDYYTMYFNRGLSTAPTLYAPPWEVDVNFDPTRDYGSYLSVPGTVPIAPSGTGTGGNYNAFNTPNNPPRYVAAWHDDMPAMIRILIKVDDPNNKVKDGPWYEYVFRLK
jgi:prepilin-type N-terminal cleavage/methylation domain-containing protein